MNTPTTNSKKVLVIGSGPIIIGQAAEFDYAGTQACRALKEEGIYTILVNTNPATIMTDVTTADKIYIEPLTVASVARIIDTERPEGLLPTLGGQTGLNLAVQLAEEGVLEKYNVSLLGTPLSAIKKAEDRDLFRQLLTKIKEPYPKSFIATSTLEAINKAHVLGLPVVVRPAYTLGGTGGGIATTEKELEALASSGISASPINQVLIEQSLGGWREVEYEVMRDGKGTCITICNMENLDPMGVHTGDSIVVAPSQTLSDKEYQMLRSASQRIIGELNIQGGCNIQFALRPNTTPTDNPPMPSEYFVIEVNPRVSRSSALASKATGYPIARVAAKIAIGKTLDSIENSVTKSTPAAFEPALDYCVVKIPRWPFDKFPFGDRSLGTQMKATGEVMTIDRTFEAALQKAIRALEITGRTSIWEDPSWSTKVPLHPQDTRIWALFAAIRKGVSIEKINKSTGIDTWFLSSIARIVENEKLLIRKKLDRDLLLKSKRLGFSDVVISALTGQPIEKIQALRKKWSVFPVFKMVDTCAGEFEAETPYFYSTYEQENEALPEFSHPIIVIGSGPIRIGQGVEFDYGSVHAARALRKAGESAIMVNSNPETVSTDFDASSRLYFEPLDEESLLDILQNEENGTSNKTSSPSVVVQFGGQTGLNLALPLAKKGYSILGSPGKVIDAASDRDKFEHFLRKENIPYPPGMAVKTLSEAMQAARNLGYPLLVRPSYVLGGRGMEILHNDEDFTLFIKEAFSTQPGKPVLVDKYLLGREVEVDAVSDGASVLIPGIMEHVERAGVHSGDSIAIYPSLSISKEEEAQIIDQTSKIARGLGIKGLLNIQFVIPGKGAFVPQSGHQYASSSTSTVHVIEANPRSSRTVPFISKATGVPLAEIAINIMLGKSIKEQGYPDGLIGNKGLIAVKAPVFSMSKLTGVDTQLGPEMKSTGEVMGVDSAFRPALIKALIAAGLNLPSKGTALLSLANRDKSSAAPLIKALASSGYDFYATQGTALFIKSLGITSKIRIAHKINEGTPDVTDTVRTKKIDFVINTPSGEGATEKDGFEIRRAAAETNTPCFTSLDTAIAAAETLSLRSDFYNIQPITKYLGSKNQIKKHVT